MPNRVLNGHRNQSARRPHNERRLRVLVLGAVGCISIWIAATVSAVSQSGECGLVADHRNPTERILRCGDDLVVRTAHGTRYYPIDQHGKEPPTALRLDAGALMIEFHPRDAQKNFQILTPHAIAAVRGTKWVVDVHPTRTSTLVISGAVAVARLHAEPPVVLKPGEGADISSGTGPIAAKRWPRKRVRALLARFGE
jgi:ferric-dicitrate binding protein FerR (iron transport regulator)